MKIKKMKDIIKQRFKNKSTEELLNIVKTGQPSFTYDAIEVAEEVLSERNVLYTSSIQYEKKGSHTNRQKNSKIKSDEESSGVSTIFKILGIIAVICFIGLIVIQNPYLGITNFNVGIDNPTDKEITIRIDDGDPIVLLPNKLSFVPIKKGGSVIKVGDTKEHIFLDKEENYLLNPTRSQYVLEEAIFTSDVSDNLDLDAYRKIPVQVIMVDSMPAIGPFRLTNEFIITDWDLSVTVPMPTSVKSKYQYAKRSSKVKVYRKKEFIEKQKGIQIKHQIDNYK